MGMIPHTASRSHQADAPSPRRARKPGKPGLRSFIADDHRFVFLGTSVAAACGARLALLAEPQQSMFSALPAMNVVCLAIFAAWTVAAAVAGIYKLTHWHAYAHTSPFVQPAAQQAIRYCSYVVWLAVALVAIDRAVFGFIQVVRESIALTQNPNEFLPGMIYMVYNSWGIYERGIVNTILLAIFGTIFAFLLSLILVFLRLQKIDRSDNYLVRFFKVLGNKIAALYSTIIRGTPMLVQGLIIYYTGFNVMRAVTGLSTGEIQGIWTFFVAALVTISLCSAAYMAEVLRASIEAIDVGQLEAARSLGMTQWMAMRKIVFPQGIKNAVPALSNELVINIKDSSVLSVVGVFDLMYATTSIAGIYFRQMELYYFTALVYLVMTLIAGKVLNVAMARFGMATKRGDVPQPGMPETPGTAAFTMEVIGNE